ncbi:hypothetical protein ACQPZF_09920 [Actinosynnema sp. CS-041913]|uniref:hypothetical protein n=1 Tax=Actinosynnema sp. CS-041913 TaxID=3239917 RepID=UPI003D8AB364
MLDGFISFLADHLADKGVAGMVKTTVGILAFGSVLAASFGSTPLKAAFLLTAGMYVLAALATLAGSRSALHRKVVRRDHLLARYCDLIYDEIQPLWRIDRWEESAEVADNGDVSASILVHAFVQRDRLRFYRVRLGPNWDQPMSSRRKVRVKVAGIEVGGAAKNQCESTSSWLPDGRLEVLVHFPTAPPRKGDEVVLRFEVHWPQKATPLMRSGRPDEFVMLLGNPLAYLRYRVTLPAGVRVHAIPVGLQAGVDSYRLETSTTGGNRPVVELVAHDIAADRRFGMRLDLR